MMNFREQDWRNRRSLLNQGMNFPPMHYTIANYCTDHKSDLNTPFAQEDLLTKLHSIPDPLKKNLADSVIGIEEKNNKNKGMPPNTKDYYQPNMESEAETTPMVDKSDAYPSLTGITTFIANFFGAISGAMFQRRAKSPVRYYDCFEPDPDRRERAPPSWQASKYEDQNKNGAPEFSTDPLNDNMNKNCRDAVFKCEGKLNAVRDLLLNKSEPCKPKYRRKPRKLFVEPGSVEERFEDAFTPEDFVSLSSEQYIKCNGITNNHQEDLCEADGPKIKTEIGYVQENDIIKAVPEIEEKIKTSVNETKVPTEDRMKPTIVEDVIPTTITEEIIGLAEPTTKTNIQEDCVQKVTGYPKPEIKAEIILSCEDKMAKLKSLLQEKRKNKIIVPDLTVTAPKPVKEDERPKKPSKNIPIEKVTDKHFKNPNRISVDKRKRSKLRKNIQDDILFANEIDSEDISLNNSPSVSTIPEMEEEDEKEYFDEVRGRFQPSSVTDSEDSFQIVFSDSPKSRSRKPSDCDSEDSFIVFEDSPDSCYTSNDVFGDVTESDSESDSEVSDSGVSEICKMSHTFSRTVSDLTDDSLYNDNRECDNDEVDCAVRSLDEIAVPEVPEVEPVKPGLLINEAKKLQRKGQPSKSVSFCYYNNYISLFNATRAPLVVLNMLSAMLYHF